MIMGPENRQLTNLTHSMIKAYYTGMSTFILERLHSDIVWINNLESQCLYGYYCVSDSLFKTPRPPQCHISFGHSHLMPLTENTWIVSCEYRTASQGLETGSMCSTFIWKDCYYQTKLVYVHMSPSCAISPLTEKSPEILMVQDRHAQVYRFRPGDILYIEACDVRSRFCCTSGQVISNQSLSALEKNLPPFFMRVHRSFIVNKQHVRKLFRYGLDLSNGIRLPVPEKRYMQVMCWLET